MVQEKLVSSEKNKNDDNVYRDEPEWRFPQFSDSWSTYKLSDFLEFISTNSLSRAKLNLDEGMIKNIHYGDIHTKFPTIVDVAKEEIPYINLDEDTSKFKKEQFCKDGDLIIADASEDYTDIGKAIELVNVNTDLVAGLHTILARDKLDKTVTGFKGYLFLTEDLRKKIKINANGISVLGISKNNIANLDVKLPSKQEQEKIVSFLRAVDKKIELLEKKIVLYQKTIDFNITHIFSEINDFEEIKLKNIVKSYSSNLSINKLEENQGNYPLYGAEGIIKYIDFYDIETPYISIIKDGAGVGRLNLCEKFSSPLGTLQCLIPNENIDINYLYYYMKTIEFRKYIVGSTIPHIYFKDYSNEKIKVPSLKNQQYIGNYFSLLKKRNDMIKREIEVLNTFKQGLLQKMFV